MFLASIPKLLNTTNDEPKNTRPGFQGISCQHPQMDETQDSVHTRFQNSSNSAPEMGAQKYLTATLACWSRDSLWWGRPAEDQSSGLDQFEPGGVMKETSIKPLVELDHRKHDWRWKPLLIMKTTIMSQHNHKGARSWLFMFAKNTIHKFFDTHRGCIMLYMSWLRVISFVESPNVAKKRRGSPSLPAATRECLGFWSIRCHCLHSQQPQYFSVQWIAMAAALHSGFAGCILTAHQTWQPENPTIYVDEFPSE